MKFELQSGAKITLYSLIIFPLNNGITTVLTSFVQIIYDHKFEALRLRALKELSVVAQVLECK